MMWRTTQQPLQGHVRAIATAFMSLTGLVLFCLILKLAKTNRNNPLQHLTGTGRNDITALIVLLALKLVTCVLLFFGSERRKKVYLYPFVIWHFVETPACIVTIFYGVYLLFKAQSNNSWEVSFVILLALVEAILDIWFLNIVISFYQELSKESLQTQNEFPIDAEFYAKGYGDVPTQPHAYKQESTYRRDEIGFQQSKSNGQPYRKSNTHQLIDSKGYETHYGQHNQYA